MSFDLEITIAGLCLLVPEHDAAGRPRSLHVLMPRTPSAGDHAHRPLLFDLKRYHDPNAGDDDAQRIELWDQELDLSPLTSDTPLDLGLSPEVFSFGKAHTRRNGDRALLGWPGLPNRLRSRVRLNSGAEVKERLLPGGLWMLEGVEFQMATAIVWRLRNVPGDQLELSVAPKPLTPIDEGDGPVIRLFLLHVTQKEELDRIPSSMPGPTWEPDPSCEARHFHHFYPLVKPPQPAPNPLFLGLPGGASVAGSEYNFGSELTCMLASADPG